MPSTRVSAHPKAFASTFPAAVIALGLALLAAPARSNAEEVAAAEPNHGDHAACPLHAETQGTQVDTTHDGAIHDHDAASMAHGHTPSRENAERMPQQVGQDAFAALAEIRRLLDADPSTDWARVDLDALREHLIDMHRVVLFAEVTTRPIAGGFEARLTGDDRTREALHRMLPAHARHVAAAEPGWHAEVASAPEASRELLLRVTTDRPADVARLRGLGVFGFLTSGDHHRPHHLAMASGHGHP